MRILCLNLLSVQSVQLRLTLETSWTAAHQASLSITNSWTLLKLMSHRVGDAIQHSHPLSSPSSTAFSLSQHHGLFQLLSSLHQVAKILEFSASASVLPRNIKDWFPLGLTGLSPCSPGDSQESSPAPQFKRINSLALSFLYGPTLTSIHDCWKNHSFDKTDLCW